MLSVYLAFAYQPEHAGFSERLSRPFVEVHGRDAPGRLISYVWAARPDTDDWIENPYTGKAGYMKILSDVDSPRQQWISHKVNLLDDLSPYTGLHQTSCSISPFQQIQMIHRPALPHR